VVVALASGGRARGDAEADDEAFRRWATALSEKQHRPLCALGALTYKDSKIPGRFAWFNDPAQPHVNRLVLESAGRRWLFRRDERADWGGTQLACAPGSPKWDELDGLTLEFVQKDSDVPQTSETITLLDGEPVLLSDDGRGAHDDYTTDWVGGTKEWGDPHPLEDERLPSQNQHMLFALPEGSRWWAKVPAPPVDVTFGRKRWTGKADADLAVRVLVVPEGFRVELGATDDRAVPPADGADARAVVRADHFELWFCPDFEEASGCKRPPAQLAVARTASGGVLAMWLRPYPGMPVPAASLDGDCLVVTLPRAFLSAEPKPNGRPTLVPLTVAYSDSDDPAAGQQTMVATASIKKANPDQPSLLAVPDGDRPFPRWPRARPLAPGEDIFAEDPACGARAVAKARAEASAPTGRLA
jgi:hypothetical protein